MINKMKIEGNIYTPGVYGMKIAGTEEYLYIGSSIEINDAFSRHGYFLKRGLYTDTNKAILQEKYDIGVLEFVVIKESEHKHLVKDMSVGKKEDLQKALSTLEQFYINLYKTTVCNVQKSVTKHSSNRDGLSTYKRRKANIGTRNPNVKYDERIIAEILWLKLNGYKPKEIEKLYEEIGIKSRYIVNIGLTRWIHTDAIMPNFLHGKEVESIGVETTSKVG